MNARSRSPRSLCAPDRQPEVDTQLPQETVVTLRDDALGALNTLVGFASLLARDEAMPVETRRRYASHLASSADAIRDVITRLEPITSPLATSEMRIVAVAHSAERILRSLPPSHPPSFGPSTAQRARILVVDSDHASRDLLAAYLESSRYEILLADGSAEAIRIAGESSPALVLIDATRAHEEGFETARRLKASVVDEFTAFVFITAFGDGDARTRALDAGAVQFLEKPIGRNELRARVRNLLHLRSEQCALAVQNAQLRSLQAFKDEMTALVIHDLKSPLSAMTMNLDVALAEASSYGDLNLIREALQDCQLSGTRMFRMIANLLDIGRNEDGHLVPNLTKLNVGSLVQRIVNEHAMEAEMRSINLRFDERVTRAIEGDADLLERVLENLIENAFRFTRPRGNILVDVRETHDLEILVANDGPPIPMESRGRIFEKYEQVQGADQIGVHRGLGLYFCSVAIRAHGGRMYLSEEPGYSTCFRIVLPRWEIMNATMAPNALSR
jgi:two-component system sensor histidine kinase/response regulator